MLLTASASVNSFILFLVFQSSLFSVLWGVFPHRPLVISKEHVLAARRMACDSAVTARILEPG